MINTADVKAALRSRFIAPEWANERNIAVFIGHDRCKIVHDEYDKEVLAVKRQICAIKHVREKTGMSLKQAHELVMSLSTGE